MGFFEEEAVRINESFFTKNETQKFIADNKDKIIDYINIATSFIKPLVDKSKYQNDYVPGQEAKSFCMDELQHSAKSGNLKCVVGMFEYDEEREELIKDKIAKFKNDNFKLTVEYRKIGGEEYSEIYMNINA